MKVTVMLHEAPARSLHHITGYLTHPDPHVRSKAVLQIQDDQGNYHFIPFPFTPLSEEGDIFNGYAKETL
jgi:hypothetical protein